MLIEQEQEEQEISRQLLIQEQNKAKQQKRQADDFIDDLVNYTTLVFVHLSKRGLK